MKKLRDSNIEYITRQERREKRRINKKNRIPKHGKSLGTIYLNSLKNRIGK